MVARPGTYQASNNSGELKPELHGRTDLKQFYGGLAYARNIEPVPQGGSRQSPRTRHLGRVRRPLAQIDQFAATPNLNGIVGAVTLYQVDFYGNQPLSIVVASSLSASQALGYVARFEFYSTDAAAWLQIGPDFKVTQSSTNMTASTPPGAPVTASSVRLRLFAPPPSITNFAIGGVTAFKEAPGLPQARLLPFTFSLEQTYEAVMMETITDIYRDGVFVGTALTGFSATQLPTLTAQQRFDTMLLFHEGHVPVRLLRDGVDSRWLVDAAPFTNIPVVDLGGSYGNAVVDVWTIFIRHQEVGPTADEAGIHNFGHDLSVAFTVNGEETGPVNTGPGVPDRPNWVAFAALVKAAIEALPSIGPGITVTATTTGGATSLLISFSGEDNLGSTNVMSAQVLNASDAAATSSHTQFGKPGGEPLISEAAGYPACGLFYQDRLAIGGFRSKRSALLASVTGDYFNLNIDLVAAAGAILNNLDTDGAERIQYMARSRHMVIFTSDAEYFISDRALSKTVTPTVVNSSRNGSAPGIGVVESEGSLIYASRNNALIYAATYDDVSTSYVSAPISLLASHIASEVSGMALQRASTATDAARLWLPRVNGTMTLGTMLRGEAVSAFTRWETSGQVRSVCVDGKNVASLLVERTVGGVQEVHLERLELGLIFDDTIEQTFGAPTTGITGLAHLEGAVVYAQADGYVSGPYTVAGGAITLADASSHVLVGRWTPLRAITLPLPSEVSERVVLRRPKRVHTVKLDLVDSTSVAIGANAQPPRNVTLARAGDPIDTAPAPVTRTINVTGLRGFSADGQVEITQSMPGQLAWRGITIEART